VVIWLGLCKLGALMVPVNEAYKGSMLRHQVRDSAATIAIVDRAHVPRWIDIAEEVPELKLLALYPDLGEAINTPWECVAVTTLRDADGAAMPRAVEYFDPMAIFYTSGTTGPSKGVLYSYAQAHATAAPMARLCSPDDVFYMFLPMFHVGLSNMFGIVIIAGATMAIRDRFSASQFWPDVRRYRATFSILLSTMPNFLLAQPASADERGHSLAKVIVIPLPGELEAFKNRFGCAVTTFYNMTEVSIPITTDWAIDDWRKPGSCGWAQPNLELRVVDEHDREVAAGEPGELVVRPRTPESMFSGYYKMPEETVGAFRNLWYHTGDLVRIDEDGELFFVDRKADYLRRRGENVSSLEVEEIIRRCGMVADVAVHSIPADDVEDEIKVCVVAKPDTDVDPLDLAEYCAANLPYFAVPRYFEVVDDLPRTPTGRVQKFLLRQRGLTDATWDRVAAGFEVKR